jgi:hypothetical protein
MRNFLAVILLGASLAFGASAALAGDSKGDKTLDPFPSYQVQAPDRTLQVAPAGSTTPQPTWLQYRLENIGQ